MQVTVDVEQVGKNAAEVTASCISKDGLLKMGFHGGTLQKILQLCTRKKRTFKKLTFDPLKEDKIACNFTHKREK